MRYLNFIRSLKDNEKDVHELIRLQNSIKKGEKLSSIDKNLLFASFGKESVFSIFYKDAKVLKAILKMLQ